MSPRASRPGKSAPEPWTLKDTLWVLSLPALVLLVFTFILAIGNVSGSSMDPLYDDDTIIIASRWTKPERQDIVMIRSSALDEMIVKRVIALPGDTVEVRESAVYLNGRPLEEPYVKYPGGPDAEALTVPAGMLFVLGDNRAVSLDSRSPRLGLIPEGELVGPVILSLHSPVSLDFLKALKS